MVGADAYQCPADFRSIENCRHRADAGLWCPRTQSIGSFCDSIQLNPLFGTILQFSDATHSTLWIVDLVKTHDFNTIASANSTSACCLEDLLETSRMPIQDNEKEVESTRVLGQILFPKTFRHLFSKGWVPFRVNNDKNANHLDLRQKRCKVHITRLRIVG